MLCERVFPYWVIFSLDRYMIFDGRSEFVDNEIGETARNVLLSRSAKPIKEAQVKNVSTHLLLYR